MPGTRLTTKTKPECARATKSTQTSLTVPHKENENATAPIERWQTFSGQNCSLSWSNCKLLLASTTTQPLETIIHTSNDRSSGMSYIPRS